MFIDQISPIRLAESTETLGGSVRVVVSGWGSSNRPGSTILRYLALTTITNTDCARTYGSSVVIESTVCTASGADICDVSQ